MKKNNLKKFLLLLLIVVVFTILREWDDFILGLTGRA